MDSEEGGVPVGEDAAVGGHQPVASTVGAGRHAHDRAGQAYGPGRALEAGVTEGVDTAVRTDQPVTAPVGGGGHAHDRPSRWSAKEVAEGGGVEGVDVALRPHFPVPTGGRIGGHPGRWGRGQALPGHGAVERRRRRRCNRPPSAAANRYESPGSWLGAGRMERLRDRRSGPSTTGSAGPPPLAVTKHSGSIRSARSPDG